MSCCGTMEQFRATKGTLNTLNFKKKSLIHSFDSCDGSLMGYGSVMRTANLLFEPLQKQKTRV